MPKNGKEKNMEREQVTIRLPVELKEKLQEEAEKKGVGLNALILEILDGARKNQDE